MSKWELISFVFLAAACCYFVIAFRRARDGVARPEPTQFWLQDFLVMAICYGGYLTLNLGNTESLIKGAVFSLAGVLTVADFARGTAWLQKAPARAVTALTTIVATLALGGLAILLGWLLRSCWILFRKQKSATLLSAASVNRVWMLLPLVIYALAFPLPTGISIGSGSSIPGWAAYALAFDGIANFAQQFMTFSSDVPWTANVFFWLSVGVFLEGRFGLSVCHAVLALACGLSFYVNPDQEVLKFCPAYHIWLGSMGVMGVLAAAAFLRARQPLRTTAYRSTNAARTDASMSGDFSK